MNAVGGMVGLKGFDTDRVVTYGDAQSMYAAGYRFAGRYLPRVTAHPNDLSRDEIDALHTAGLAVFAVQHVESESSWEPTIDKGRAYGDVAAQTARALQLSLGTTIFLDLEGVAPGVDHETVIQFCNYWFDRVSTAGFDPGLYVGWHCGLTPVELRKRLKCTRYWGSYNLNADEYPAECGIGMKQHAAKLSDLPYGVSLTAEGIDVNKMIGDAFGRFPTVCAPDGWIQS